MHPFDDDRFIAGNGTAGLEILEDLPDVDAIVAPLGGKAGRGKIVAVVSGGNIDLTRFASVVGACTP